MEHLSVKINEKDLMMSVCYTSTDQTVYSIDCLNLCHLYTCQYFTLRVLKEPSLGHLGELNRIYFPPGKEKL